MGWNLILGESLYNAINNSLGDFSNKTQEYVKCAIDMHGVELLRNQTKRNIIIQKLTPDEVEILATRLNISDEMPYKALVNSKIQKNSQKEKVLFDFFEQEIPIVLEKNEQPTLELVGGTGYPLHGYQERVVSEALKRYNAKQSNFMIHMPTGSGKTRVAMNLISRILLQSKTVIVWLAYSEELCEQAITEFKKAWSAMGDRQVSISRFYDDHQYREIDDGLLVAGLSKLWSHRKKNVSFIPNLSSKCNLIVFDEAHQSVANTYMSMLEELKFYSTDCRFLGLSATPGRTDDEETKKLVDLFDYNKIVLQVDGYSSPIQYLYDEGYLSKPIFTELVCKSNIKTEEDSDYNVNVLKMIGSNDERNTVILNATINAIRVKNHKKIILFAASVDSAEYLTFRLKNEGINAMVITSSTDESDRALRIEKFKKETDNPTVLCNYGILTTGFDVPDITAVVIARPTNSMILYSQMVGRGLRGCKMGGTEYAEIITVADTDLPGYGSVIQAFKKWDRDWNE